MIRDPETYERFDKVVLVHGVRFVSELAYTDFIARELPQNEYFGERCAQRLIYYPTVTSRALPQHRPHHRCHRLRRLFADLACPELEPGARPRDDLRQPGDEQDCDLLDARGFRSPRIGVAGSLRDPAGVEK